MTTMTMMSVMTAPSTTTVTTVTSDSLSTNEPTYMTKFKMREASQKSGLKVKGLLDILDNTIMTSRTHDEDETNFQQKMVQRIILKRLTTSIGV